MKYTRSSVSTLKPRSAGIASNGSLRLSRSLQILLSNDLIKYINNKCTKSLTCYSHLRQYFIGSCLKKCS